MTIGNPEALLEWLAGSSGDPRRVVSATEGAPIETDVKVDHVGSTQPWRVTHLDWSERIAYVEPRPSRSSGRARSTRPRRPSR